MMKEVDWVLAHRLDRLIGGPIRVQVMHGLRDGRDGVACRVRNGDC